MKDAPETPLLPLFVGYKGQSVQNSNKVNAVKESQKLAEEIGQDLQNPNEIPNSNTLAKFNILARLIRTMNAKQIDEAGRQMFAPQSEADNHNSKSSARNSAWKAFRDATAEAGTPAAANQVMEWVEQKKVEGEEAAQLIASLPKTIRIPTESLMRRFFVR